MSLGAGPHPLRPRKVLGSLAHNSAGLGACALLKFFSQNDTIKAIDALSSGRLTVFVGAGASKEMALPTWQELVDSLARKALSGHDYRAHATFLRERLLEHGVLGAAERVQVLLGDKLRDAIRSALYGSDEPSDIVPGPLSAAVAAMKVAFGDDLKVATTNYDQLLLTAMRKAGLINAKSHCVQTEQVGVVHLHGVIGYEDPADGGRDVVLTESDYLSPARGGWRQDFMRDALSGPCLFVGASLTDLNLLRSLHDRPKTRAPRYVVFVRDDLAPNAVAQARLERIEQRRWSKLGIRALFCDEYADVAQLAFEVAYRRSVGATAYASYPERFDEWWDRVSRGSLSVEDHAYAANQRTYAASLGELLRAMQKSLNLDRQMSLGVCALFTPEVPGGHERPVIWVTSDRAMTTPSTMEFLPYRRKTGWTAVRSLCLGTALGERKDVYASRWRYVYAEPIFEKPPERLLVGAVMLSTMTPEDETRLPVRTGTGPTDWPRLEQMRDALLRAGELVLLG